MSMQAPVLLPPPPAQAAAIESLRESMASANCVLDFTVCQVADGEVPAEAHHRALLARMFDEIGARGLARRAEFIALHPAYAAQPAWTLVYDLGSAQSTPWCTQGLAKVLCQQPGERIAIDRASVASGAEWLFQAFDNPPYPADCPPGLFGEFCRVVGLSTEPGVKVFDWVGDMDAEPQRSTWSNYFDDGKEWWGIWCLSIWNPAQRTLAALAASTTD